MTVNLNGKEEESSYLLVPERLQMHNVKKSDAKIQKIQGLRGIAIFVVLFYHIRSDWFPYGHLGVDVFFAISGYLICHILSKENYLNPQQILNFYFRRIKRILPIYLIVILVFITTAPFLWLHPLFFNWFVGLAQRC
ncbi:Acyltransferase [Aphelenchoides bicaudatus]|nr:Acyltransferase [Aphelenchoides bicaudatus]